MSDEDTRDLGTADQDEGTSDDLDNKDDTDTGSDDAQNDSSGKSEDGAGGGDGEGGFEQKFKDQQGRAKRFEESAKSYRQRLIDAGLDPETGKPKEKPTPKKGGNALSDDDRNSINQAVDRSERAALRSLGITHPEDVKYVRDAAKRLGVDVEEAAVDELVKGKLERMQAVRKTKDATPDPSNRGGSRRSSKLPDFSKMSDKEFDEWERKNSS